MRLSREWVITSEVLFQSMAKQVQCPTCGWVPRTARHVSKYRHVVSTYGRCPGLEARLGLPEASSPRHLALRGCKGEGAATCQWHEPCSPLQSGLFKSAFKSARHVCSSSKVERLLSPIEL